MKQIQLKAYGKINLFLEVCEKRSDGYHNIDTIMHSIGLHDVVAVSVTTAKQTKISLTCSCPNTPTDSKNTAYRAARGFCNATDLSLAVDIHIEKHIPSKAGLGGASADAAAVLCGLNKLMDHPLSEKDLLDVGATIGADVPFCIVGKCAKATGIGEIMTPLPVLPPCYIVIGKGGTGVSTAKAYAGLPLREKYKSSEDFADALGKGDFADMAKHSYNAFESVMVKDSKRIKKILSDAGANVTLLSGSGSAVYGLFECPDMGKQAANALSAQGFFSYFGEIGQDAGSYSNIKEN